MSSHLAAVATLALAIFFSPETLVLGLIITGDRRHPRLAAGGFALGGVLGIAFATGIGLTIAHLTDASTGDVTHPPTWAGFFVRVAIAAVLLVIGLSRVVNALRRQPIPDVTHTEQKPSRFRAVATRVAPGLMREFEPGAQLSPHQSISHGLIGGFAMCGLHPKVFPVAIAAGHQITQITRPGERALGVVLFAAISVIPAVLPLLIELVRPGASGRIKEGYERIMKVHGRWITAALLLGAAAFVAHNAWEKFPGR
ncbi:MAG: GAP family protein [Mycobacteriaceae bacterium]